MDCLWENGHTQRVTKNRLEHPFGVVWYLTHHPVMNPNKPDNVRVVFDCAAQYNGVSLNSRLLHYPGLTNNLVGVLARFRQEPIAATVGVNGMFHPVHVNPKDGDALRFLWWHHQAEFLCRRLPQVYSNRNRGHIAGSRTLGVACQGRFPPVEMDLKPEKGHRVSPHIRESSGGEGSSA